MPVKVAFNTNFLSSLDIVLDVLFWSDITCWRDSSMTSWNFSKSASSAPKAVAALACHPTDYSKVWTNEEEGREK